MGGGNVLMGQNSFCGSILRAPIPHIEQCDGPIFYDRFGNTYLLSELINNTNNVQLMGGSCSNSNFFNLVFTAESGTSWTVEEQETICSVFHYIASLMSYTGTITIPVIKANGLPESGSDIVLGGGSPFWNGSTCGLSNITIVDAMNGTAFSENFEHGFLLIKHFEIEHTYNWHTLDEDLNSTTPNLAANEYDLYTVALHEALHILGFASRISNTGAPTSTQGTATFSKWDAFLYQIQSTNNVPLIVEDILIGSCCEPYIFNYASIVPSALYGSCNTNVVFSPNGSSVLAPINRTLSESPDMGNRLSHLQIDCKDEAGISNTDDYVMHPVIDLAETRRIITLTELEILCNLGYPMLSEGCSNSNCISLINNENFIVVISESPTLTITHDELLENDIYSNSVTVDFLPDCGVLTNFIGQSGLLVDHDTDNSLFNITALLPGNYYFCYSVNCNNECETGFVNILVMSNPIPMECASVDCNLVCYGNFEDFTHGVGNYGEQIDEFFNQFGYPFDNQHLSPDIFPLNPSINQNLHLAVKLNSDASLFRENGSFPLSHPISPGCTITIGFKASSGSLLPNDVSGLLRIFAVNTSPENCTPATIIPINYNGVADNYPTSFISCPPATEIPLCNATAYPITNNLPECAILVPTVNYPSGIWTLAPPFETYSIMWINNTTEDIEHLLFVADATYPENTEGSICGIFIDDVIVQSSCVPIININGTPQYDCINNEAAITYQICLNEESPATSILLDLQAQNLSSTYSLAFNDEGDFDEFGQAQTLLTPGICANLT